MRSLSLALLLAQIIIILIFWRSLPPQLPLFYSRPWGEEQLATPAGLFLLPLFSAIVFLINFLFVNLIPKEEKLIPKILITTSAVFNLLCLITLIQIIKLVI